MLLYRIFEDLAGLLFPDLCCACGTYLYQGEQLICTNCIYRLPYTDYHLHADNKAARQLWGRIPCHAVMSLLYFRKGSRTQNIIHSLKYKGRMDIGIKLGHMIAYKLMMNSAYNAIDVIIPVPLHRNRERLRGYNQSLSIAEGIATVLKVPVYNNCLLRKKATISQTKRDRYTRFQNMQTVFSVTDVAGRLEGLHVLLVDDVITTGATLEACGTALFEGKIWKLSIATVAFAE